MKRIKVIAVIMLVVMSLSIPNITLAYDDYCECTEDGQHDFSYISEKTTAHPHEGFRECLCGEVVYFEESYIDDCKKCRKALCKEGIHYYLADVHYNDLFSGYGECYCGKKKNFTSYMNGKNWYEPYPGMISIIDGSWEVFVEANHPHREYDPYSGSRYYKEQYDGNIGNCGACELKQEYIRKVEEYEIYTIINETYYYDEWNSVYEYDEDYYYEDDYDYDEWDEDESHYNEPEYIEYYDEDYYEEDDFYEWLELAKEILAD